jgi:hypothetical protein
MAPSAEYLDLLMRVHDRIPAMLEEMHTLHVKKNAGYSGVDNPDPWANFRRCERYGIDPIDGVLTRISDKDARVETLFTNPDNEQVGESIEDSLMDGAAYRLILVCLLREMRE